MGGQILCADAMLQGIGHTSVVIGVEVDWIELTVEFLGELKFLVDVRSSKGLTGGPGR